jgi:HAD superfamily hydrolase (TIGR01662 family)
MPDARIDGVERLTASGTSEMAAGHAPASRSGLRRFEDIAFPFRNALVLLDVDGTIVPDSGRTVSDAVLRKVHELKEAGNEICLCSNSRRSDYAQRLAAIALQLDVDVCRGSFRKPSPSILAALDRQGREVVVIGDKDLTDGLLARRAGARFIKVLRKTDRADRLVSRLANMIDEVFGPPALSLWDSATALLRR